MRAEMLKTSRWLMMLLSLTLLFPALAVHADKGGKRYLTLTVGLTEDQKVNNLPEDFIPSENYDRKVVKISISKENKMVRFEPVGVGTTNFIVRNGKGAKIVEFVVNVRKTNLSAVAYEIKQLLGDIEGIEIKQVNGRVLVDGEILLPRDMNRIYSVIAQFPDVASSIVTLSPLAQKKISEMIERDIGNPEIRVRAVNEKFILEGVADSDAEKQKAVIIAKTYVPDVIVDAAEKDGVIRKRKFDSVIDLLTVKPGPEPQPGKMIKLIVHYVELKKDYEKGFRFQWTPSLKDGSSVSFRTPSSSESGGLVSTITGTIDGLLPKLNFAKNHGHARVLQSSSIIVQDGSAGIIQSVTRIPYLIQNQYGQQSTAFEEAGLDTQITPTLVSSKSDSVNLQISFKIKALQGMTEKGPIISNNTIQTKVIVRSSQSAAIGGLVNNSSGTDYNKLPKDMTENPILSLYASKDFRRDQSQFVVFVTPVIMSSASQGSDEIKKKFRLRE